MKKLIVLSFLGLSLAIPSAYSEDTAVKTDNTKINKRDRAETAKTADQQTMGAEGTELTRSIREEIMALEDASSYARNVKIITTEGQVTLKGPVRTQAERNSIVRIAKAKAGKHQVVDQMTVEPETK